MTSTRIRNDPIRIFKEMEIFTNPGRFAIETPKWNDSYEFIEDPHVRIQNWEGNKYNNRVDIENDIQGYTKPLSRDYVEKDQYKQYAPTPNKNQYGLISKTITDESRATLPAFLFRDLEVNRFETPFINPQDRIEREFAWNIDTRLIEKDRLYDKHPTECEFNSQFWLPGN